MDSNFVWIRRDIETGSVNLFISRYNDKNNNSIFENKRLTLSIIPGPVENTFMSTDPIYTPSSQQNKHKRKTNIRNKGVVEIKGQFMAGPFLNYKFESNTKQDEYIMLMALFIRQGQVKGSMSLS